MNTLKPLLIIAIVGGIGYGAWSRLNRKADSGNQAWDTPAVQMGDPKTNWSPGGAPTAPGADGAAPTFNGLASGATNDSNAASPPIVADGANPAVTSQPPMDQSPADQAPAGQPLDGAPQFANQAPASGGAPGEAPPYGAAATTDPGVPAAYPQTTDPALASGGATNANTGAFGAVLEVVRRELDAGRLAEGLFQLSEWYNSPKLSPGEQQQLNALLDQVAGTVIYSTRSFGEPPYEVLPGERLEDIASRCNISPQLLAKINGLEDPQNLRPGDHLKIVHGPFEASISLEKRVLTLWVNGSYAGRFPVGFGRDWPPRDGLTLTVEHKDVNPVYHGADRQIPGGDPSNPLGGRWLGLGEDYGIHGTNDPNSLGSPDQLGCIAMNQRDLEDLFDILTVGARVTIHR